jgi:hypothetical protein
VVRRRDIGRDHVLLRPRPQAARDARHAKAAPRASCKSPSAQRNAAVAPPF